MSTARALAANWTGELGDVLAGGMASIDTDALSKAIDTARHGRAEPGSRMLMAEELWSFDPPGTQYDSVTGPLAYSVGAYSSPGRSSRSRGESTFSEYGK